MKAGFEQKNYLGMNAPDYGGGTPVVDVWCRDAGIAVGHVEMAPKLVSLPVMQQGPDQATVAIMTSGKVVSSEKVSRAGSSWATTA